MVFLNAMIAIQDLDTEAMLKNLEKRFDVRRAAHKLPAPLTCDALDRRPKLCIRTSATS